MYPITSIKQLPVFQQTYEVNSYSTDSERNSNGTCSHDSVFEIESMSSCEETPCLPHTLLPKCTKMVIPNVQNCCNFSTESIYLLKNGNIISVNVNNYEKREISNNRKLVDVASYNGYLYGLDKKGHLFVLCNDYYTTNYWVWTKACWAPKHIKSINATLDGDNLLIQTEKKNYLYDVNYNVNKLKFKGTRVYAADKSSYLDFHNNHCYVYVNDENVKIFNSISTGCMDHHHDVYLIPINSCQKVRMINYEPYYY